MSLCPGKGRLALQTIVLLAGFRAAKSRPCSGAPSADAAERAATKRGSLQQQLQQQQQLHSRGQRATHTGVHCKFKKIVVLKKGNAKKIF